MASSDAGTSVESEYQVFLNFRGSDTRYGCIDVLYCRLTQAGIRVFPDDPDHSVGERIDGSRQRAIDNSKIYIPVFSFTYAESHRCLRELAEIVAKTSRSGVNKQIVPIFYDVDPDDVKLKTPRYREVILEMERENKLSTEQVNAWREALMEVGATKGWELKKYNG